MMIDFIGSRETSVLILCNVVYFFVWIHYDSICYWSVEHTLLLALETVVKQGENTLFVISTTFLFPSLSACLYELFVFGC